MSHKERSRREKKKKKSSAPAMDRAAAGNGPGPEAAGQTPEKENTENREKLSEIQSKPAPADGSTGQAAELSQTAQSPDPNRRTASGPQPRSEKEKSKPGGNPWLLALVPALGLLIWLTAEMVRVQLFSMLQVGLILGAGLLVLCAALLLLQFLEGRAVRLIGTALCAVVCIASFSGQASAREIAVAVQQAARHTDTIHRTIGLYTMKQVPVASLHALEGASIGILGTRGQADADRFVQDLQEQDGVKVHTVSYPTMDSLIKAMKGQAVRAVFLSSEDIKLASAFPGMDSLRSELSLVRDFSVDTGLHNESVPVDMKTEPYTILVSASDAPLDQESYRSVLTAAVVVNPKTRTALSIFLPRSLKTRYVCPPELECIEEEDKLGLASLFSMEALKETAESLLDLTINYTVRIDMETLVSLLDYDDPLSVWNDYEYSSGNYTFREGEITMNPAMARAYWKELSDFSATDSEVQYNTGHLLRAVVEKMKEDRTLQDTEGLEMLSKAIHTNMSYTELCTFLQTFCLQPVPYELLETELPASPVWETSTILSVPSSMVQADQSGLEYVRQAAADVLAGTLPDLQAPAAPESSQGNEKGTDPEKEEEKPQETEQPDSGQPQDEQNPQQDAAGWEQNGSQWDVWQPEWDTTPGWEDPGLYDPGLGWDETADGTQSWQPEDGLQDPYEVWQ